MIGYIYRFCLQSQHLIHTHTQIQIRTACRIQWVVDTGSTTHGRAVEARPGCGLAGWTLARAACEVLRQRESVSSLLRKARTLSALGAMDICFRHWSPWSGHPFWHRGVCFVRHIILRSNLVRRVTELPDFYHKTSLIKLGVECCAVTCAIRILLKLIIKNFW